MAKEWFAMWFRDGSKTPLIWGRRELRKFAKNYDFNADEVIAHGETQMIDECGDVIGGVKRT